MQLDVGQIIEFEVLFPSEKPKTVKEYLKGGSRNIILNATSFFLGFKTNGSIYDNTTTLIKAIFNNNNQEFADDIINKIKKIEENGNTVQIINTYSSLKLFEYFFKEEEQQDEKQTEDEFEINLFKAYLIVNSEYTEKQKKAFDSTRTLDYDLKVPMMIFCMQFPVEDKSNFNLPLIWISQIIKAIYLFQFLNEDDKTVPLLRAFVKYFECDTWQEYMKRLIPLTQMVVNPKYEAHVDITVPNDIEFNKNCSFIDKLIITEMDEINETDFISLRSKPLYKVSEGVYRTIFGLFIVEKIFKGMYFILRDINAKLPEKERVSNLKSLYGYKFSEKVILYKVLDLIYHNANRISGEKMEEKKIDGATDYYIRKGRDILLFESKDFLIRADKKMSFDYDVYDAEFERILYFERLSNGKENHKAVMQLINNVKMILTNKMPLDTDYNYRDITIYPILIIHDNQYNTPGFNVLLDSWFQEELSDLEQEGYFVNRVMPLAVVDIDSLLYHQTFLSKKGVLHNVLKEYYSYIKLKSPNEFKSENDYSNHRLQTIIPFSLFINNYVDRTNNWTMPPILDILGKELFSS